MSEYRPDQGTEGLPMFTPRARTTDPDTSHDAALSMAVPSQAQRAAAHVALTKHGPMTADEIDAMLEGDGWRTTTAGRRLSELAEMGAVVRTDDKRKTRSGRMAYVWMVTT